MQQKNRRSARHEEQLLASFFLAGFECSTGWNMQKEWIDQIQATQHDRFIDDDYRMLRDVGLLAAREGVRWPLIERDGKYDFSTVEPILEAAEKHGIQLIYDLFHFGYPEHLDVFDESFPMRFADYCYAISDFIASQTAGPHFFTPVNEPSYFSWAAGQVGRFRPHATGRGRELKIKLIRAAIQGINAIREVSSEARFVNADALCRVVAPRGAEEMQAQVDDFNNIAVFESWDMLAGRLMPELGGSSAHLDVVGVNYYWTNQWEITHPEMPLGPNDERQLRLTELLEIVWQRYGQEILITETSHVGDSRADWIREVSDEIELCLEKGIVLRGVCLYPILSMPEWHARDRWTNMGLWDLEPRGSDLERVLHEPMSIALKEAQERYQEISEALSRKRKIV